MNLREEDAKISFANERTYIDWIQMAITLCKIFRFIIFFLGGISTGMLGLSWSNGISKGLQSGFDTRKDELSKWIGLILLPTGLMFAIYGIILFLVRYRFIVHGNPEEKFYPGSGAFFLGIATFLALCSIFILDIMI